MSTLADLQRRNLEKMESADAQPDAPKLTEDPSHQMKFPSFHQMSHQRNPQMKFH